MPHLYCPECGFQNPEAANYCSRCGALLVKDAPADTTMTYTPDEGEVEVAEQVEEAGVERPALVVRSGGGRYYVEDQGSLNGTFLNRRRIESAEISDGDELQVGKYRMTFLG